MGKHKAPAYRIVAIDSRAKRDGEYIELLGTYNVANNPSVSLNVEAIKKHIANGAQPSESVKNFLKKQGEWKKISSN